MATNSSSSNSSSFLLLLHECLDSSFGVNGRVSYTAVRALLTLPSCALILYLGRQRWRQQRSFKTTSHSDIFTYHLVAMQLIWCLGGISLLCPTNIPHLEEVGAYLNALTFYGETWLNVLTCVERYLAVVHPVTYMGLKNSRGVRIRNLSIGFVWLLSFGLMGLTALFTPSLPVIPILCFLVFSLTVVSFCSISTLWVLTRPGPGVDRKQTDPSKRKAFHTITAILGVLGLWFAAFLVSISLYGSGLHTRVTCVVLVCAAWFNLPSSLVLPLLFLHRAGKLACCWEKT